MRESESEVGGGDRNKTREQTGAHEAEEEEE